MDDPRARVARLPAPEGLAVVFEDEVLIAVNKPSGLLSQPGRQVEDSVVVRVRAARPDASGSLLVHRLDMDTSGVLLLAKTPEAHAALQQQFEKRQVQKRYRALIDGDVSGAGGLINLPLRLDVDRRMARVFAPAVQLLVSGGFRGVIRWVPSAWLRPDPVRPDQRARSVLFDLRVARARNAKELKSLGNVAVCQPRRPVVVRHMAGCADPISWRSTSAIGVRLRGLLAAPGGHVHGP